MVNKLLTYLFLVILAGITFICGANVSDSTETKSLDSNVIIESASYISDSCVSDAHLYLSKQTSGTNVFRVPSKFQRTNTLHKNPFEFIKVSKLISTGIRNFIDKKTLIVYSTFIKPAHRLVSLGKFLI